MISELRGSASQFVALRVTRHCPRGGGGVSVKCELLVCRLTLGDYRVSRGRCPHAPPMHTESVSTRTEFLRKDQVKLGEKGWELKFTRTCTSSISKLISATSASEDRRTRTRTRKKMLAVVSTSFSAFSVQPVAVSVQCPRAHSPCALFLTLRA